MQCSGHSGHSGQFRHPSQLHFCPHGEVFLEQKDLHVVVKGSVGEARVVGAAVVGMVVVGTAVVGAEVGARAVGIRVGASVGAAVRGWVVGAEVGARMVGSRVGAEVRTCVVGDAVGAVGADVGVAVVGTEVGVWVVGGREGVGAGSGTGLGTSLATPNPGEMVIGILFSPRYSSIWRQIVCSRIVSKRTGMTFGRRIASSNLSRHRVQLSMILARHSPEHAWFTVGTFRIVPSGPVC